jgi:hypothetical protein
LRGRFGEALSKTSESAGSKEVRLKYSAGVVASDRLSAGPAKLRTAIFHRTVFTGNLESASSYQQMFLEKSPELIPGLRPSELGRRFGEPEDKRRG